MKLALLTTDNREHQRTYDESLPRFGTAPEALLQGFARLPELEVHVVTCAQQPMSSPARLAPNIHFHSLVVPKIGWMRTGYQGCIRAVRRKLAEIKPDIVHGQGTERDCSISAVFSGFPNVLTIHGNMRLVSVVNRARPFTFDWLAARLEEFTVPRSSGVVCITRYTRHAVESLARKTWVVPNAVDASFFEVRNEPVSPRQYLCVGNISARKNQNAWIKALDAVEGDFELVFLGSSNPGHAYDREFALLLSQRARCHHAGFVGRSGLKTWLARASGLILPSTEDNCPMVVLEAMAAGVPVAASAVGGIPDLIEDGVTGFLFDPLNADSMREGFRKLLQVTGGTMPVLSRKTAWERFHPEGIARKHEEIYQEVLGSSD